MTVMKIQEEPVDEVREAIVAFFNRQEGGYQEVAKTIGVNAQQLYYIISGRNDPTLKTVMRILRYYPQEVELRKSLSLPALNPPVYQDINPTSAVAASSSITEPLIKDLLKMVDDLRGELKLARDEYRELAREYRELAKLSFPVADSQNTAYVPYALPQRAGFRQQHEMALVTNEQAIEQVQAIKTTSRRKTVIEKVLPSGSMLSRSRNLCNA